MGFFAAIPVLGPILETVQAAAGFGGKLVDARRDVALSRDRAATDTYRVGTEARTRLAESEGRVDVSIATLHADLAIRDQARRITRAMRPVLFYVCLYRLACMLVYFSQPDLAAALMIEVTLDTMIDTFVLGILSAVFAVRTYEKSSFINAVAPAAAPRR